MPSQEEAFPSSKRSVCVFGFVVVLVFYPTGGAFEAPQLLIAARGWMTGMAAIFTCVCHPTRCSMRASSALITHIPEQTKPRRPTNYVRTACNTS